MKKMAHILVLVYCLLISTVLIAADWTTRCNKCTCRWSYGKKAADCKNIGFSDIPLDLSPEIRDLDLSDNPIFGLGHEIMIKADMRDIHKLRFQNCSLESVEKTAFKGLLLLIELDLSRNSITALNKDTFRDNLKLRVLSLGNNKIRQLEQGLFYNLTHLQKISLNNNEIEMIEENLFVLLPSLQHIDLSYNKLSVITYDFTRDLPKLNSLNLEGNRWICDCRLQQFRNKTIKENLITAPTECAEPNRLRGRLWTDSVVFACLPQIVEPLPSTQIEATSSNVTLTCRVLGDPQPDVDWVTNGRIIDKDPRQNAQRFITSKQKVGEFTWNNLTITNVNYRDKGEYKCVAKNPGGEDEKNISLIVSVAIGSGGGSAIQFGTTLPLIIGLIVGAIVILLIILVLVCCCCRRSTHGMATKRGDLMQTSDECMHLHGAPEMEKALITDVNPVMKPPRVCSVPQSVTSGGTEVSEAKKNLLDNDSVFAGDDESRSLDFEMQPFRRSQNLLDPEYRGNHPYPPDLLPFPPRMCQVSPAGSSASTVADTTRLPPHHGPQSPLHSPLYDQIALYRTLPYSRSQSPFVGVAQARIPRQGYVTIPRRPRQSWSSEPPSSTTTTTATNEIGEPLYDNLGLRTTADGSSALSLNKIGNGSETSASTPKSVRMFPVLSPSGGCDTIEEIESSPPQPTQTATLPRNMESLKLSPSRTEWARANAEAFKSPDQRRNSMPEKKPTKIAPVPPPKPKKRTSTGPLFEDEGEDGTEV